MLPHATCLYPQEISINLRAYIKKNNQKFQVLIISSTFAKAFWDGDSVLSVSYTAQDADNKNGMTSSTSNSNFGKTGAIDFNNRRAMTSIYETEHRLLATLRSKHYFFGPDKPTTFTLIFERKSGLPVDQTAWNALAQIQIVIKKIK